MGRLERFRKLARLPRLKRFSLRSLLLCVLLIGSAACLWLNWGPWATVFRFETADRDAFNEGHRPGYDVDSDTFWGATNAGDLLLWNGSTGSCAARFDAGEFGYSVKGAGKGRLYLGSTKKPGVDVLDLRKREIVHHLDLTPGGIGDVMGESLDGRWLYGRNKEVEVAVWRTSDWAKEISQTFLENSSANVEFSPDSKRLKIFSWEDNWYHYWSLEEVAKLGDIFLGGFSSTNFKWYLGRANSIPKIVTIQEPPRETSLQVPADVTLKHWALVGDGAAVATDEQGAAYAFAAGTGKMTLKMESYDEIDVDSGQKWSGFSLPTGEAFAACVDSSGRVLVHDLSTGELAWTLQESGERAYSVSQVRKAGHLKTGYLAVLSDDGAVRIWDIRTGSMEVRLSSRYPVRYPSVVQLGDYWALQVVHPEWRTNRTELWSKDGACLWARQEGHFPGAIYRSVPKPGDFYQYEHLKRGAPRLLRLSRPAFWYGFLWLPEFYLTLVLALGLGWSLWRDRKL